MAIHSRFRLSTCLLLCTMLLLLSGCVQTVDSFGLQEEPVQDVNVARTIRYVDGLKEGPNHEIGLTIPNDWTESFVTRTAGNKLYFDYMTESGNLAPIFWIEALSEGQYWMQTGSYPGQQGSLINTPDTYFVYHLPVDAFYSGLPEDQFQSFAEQVPDIVTTFEIIN